MSWIRSIESPPAPGLLAGLFARIEAGSPRGRVANVWRVHGLDPPGLEATYIYYRALMESPAPLTAAQAELIALVVSATNGCGYCVAHHGPRLARALGDEALARAVARDYRAADLAARDRVLLDYAVALTCEPSERKLEDVERVREYGFDDAALLKATEIAAYYNLINRVTSALGVELEPDLEPWEFGSQR
ncbi:MAG TPA: peroxidase-related enzyme [Candidatus Eisenbacteria bacterium]